MHPPLLLDLDIIQCERYVGTSLRNLPIGLFPHILPHGHLSVRICPLTRGWSIHIRNPSHPLAALKVEEPVRPLHLIPCQDQFFRPAVFLCSGLQPVHAVNCRGKLEAPMAPHF